LRTVVATTDSDLAYLTTEDVLRICRQYPELEVRLKSFLRAGQSMGQKGRQALGVKNIIRTMSTNGLAIETEVDASYLDGDKGVKQRALNFKKVGMKVNLGVKLGGGQAEKSFQDGRMGFGDDEANAMLDAARGDLCKAIQSLVNAHTARAAT